MLWFPAYTWAWLGRAWREVVDNNSLGRDACLTACASFADCGNPLTLVTRRYASVVDQITKPSPDVANLLLMLVFLLHFAFSVSLLLIPPLAGDYGQSPGLGLLRLHSTFRHDLKIYASDEGRVQMTAAAFAKVGRFSYRRSSRSARGSCMCNVNRHASVYAIKTEKFIR